MTTPEPNSVSKSGITVDAVTGERYVPSSVRADGSRRREIRVRPGYKPPEDVELYRNKAAAAWKSRNQAAAAGGVPGAEGLSSSNTGGSGASAATTTTSTSTPPGATTTTATTGASSASNKNAKRREAKKKAKATGDQPSGSGGKNVAEIANWRAFAAGNNEPESKTESRTTESAEKQPDTDAENEKKARNLKKKLRQARDLDDKKKQGEALLPEQLEKVIKINELVRQLDSLGFDSNGDKWDANANDETDKIQKA